MTQVSRKGFVDKEGKQVVLTDPTKADKVENATTGNLASLDAEGNPTDSGYKPSDFAPANHYHPGIIVGDANENASVTVDDEQGSPKIVLAVQKGAGSNERVVVELTYETLQNIYTASLAPAAPASGSTRLTTAGQVWTALDEAASNKSDKEFCNKVYSRLMELEKESSVEYGITATYEYSDIPVLKVGGGDIIYEYDRTSEKITILYNNDYLYNLVFVGDVLVIKDLTTGTALGTAIVEELMSGPNRIRLSGLPLPYNSSYSGKSIGIAITHGSYSV